MRERPLSNMWSAPSRSQGASERGVWRLFDDGFGWRCRYYEMWKYAASIKKMELLVETVHRGFHHICSFSWADNSLILSQSKDNQEQVKELAEETKRWDLYPKPASLCSSSIHADDKREDVILKNDGRRRDNKEDGRRKRTPLLDRLSDPGPGRQS